MFGFLRDLAHSLREKGLRALASEIPVAGSLVDIVADALQRRRARHEKAELREDIEVIARIASRDEAKVVAKEIAREVADGEPLEIQLQLENYLTQVPQALRQSLRRPEDPSGKTVGARFDESPEHIAQMLPQRLPRFQAGDKPDCLRGEWVLEELLGTGGFGEVWKAHHADFDGTVAAIKFCLDPASQDRLLKHEAQLINQVMRHGSHPGIVPLLDASLRSNPPWLRYEYIPGGDLLLLFNKLKPLSIADRLKTALPFFQKLCEAVGYFHRLSPPVVHRDLKPSNILMMKQASGYRVRISDFGISQLAARHTLEQADASTPSLTMTGSLRGAHSPLYASPQQRKGEAADVRDDVYSLGVILYQLLMADPTAQRPGGLDWADELREAGVLEEVVRVIGICVADRVEKRLGDGTKVREALAAFQFARPTISATTIVQPSNAIQKDKKRPPVASDPRWRSNDEVKTGIAPQTNTFVEQERESRRQLILKEVGPLKIGSRYPNDIGMEFSWIPPGTFQMGSPMGRGKDDERPQRQVTIRKGFFMGVYPVTEEQWQRVMGNNPIIFRSHFVDLIAERFWNKHGHDIRRDPKMSGKIAERFEDLKHSFSDPKKRGTNVSIRHEGNTESFLIAREEFEEIYYHPVETLGWYDCVEFVEKLRAIDNLPYRLPSEAEWEYACRAGTTTTWFFGDDDSQINLFAWYKGNAGERKHPTGKKRQNPWGLHDILGNVWEFCEDWYGLYDQAPIDGSPQLNKHPEGYHVLRGGSFFDDPETCRPACRYGDDPIDGCNVGLRVCFSLD